MTKAKAKWWGADELYRTTKSAIDLRPGGAWRTEGRGADGSDFHVEGEVLEVDPPRRLVQTRKPSWEPGPATKIVYTLERLTASDPVILSNRGFRYEILPIARLVY